MAKFERSSECESVFQEICHRLTTAPVLAFPEYKCQSILDTDASDTGTGAVLSHVLDDGSGQVIAYGSHVLSNTVTAQQGKNLHIAVVSFSNTVIWARHSYQLWFSDLAEHFQRTSLLVG